MATTLVDGHRSWSCTRDEEGHREYKVKHLVRAATTDGPFSVLTTPGLPQPGDAWAFDDDLDLWAFCRPNAQVTTVLDKEPNSYWEVEHTFSTKPLSRCQDEQVEDPLLEPQKISGSFVKYQEEATHDRFDDRILNSAHEQIRGPQVEFDRNRPTVKIEQNVADLGLALFTSMIDTVNSAPLWGLPVRTIKLSNVSWERKFHGQCSIYYTRNLEFDVNFDTFDRDLLDEGTKVLHGHWDKPTGHWVLDKIGGVLPDSSNPDHFDHATDRQGHPIRMILNGFGIPAGAILGTGSSDFIEEDPGTITVEFYEESDFLLLGIPTVF